jgi:hypothetical protein
MTTAAEQRRRGVDRPHVARDLRTESEAIPGRLIGAEGPLVLGAPAM